MNDKGFLDGVLLTFVFVFFVFCAFVAGMTHERRNIQDFGGFTQDWVNVRWSCEVKK